MPASKRKRDTCRNRPISCLECGYKAWITRSWMDRGLPVCCCGGEFRPVKDADLAYCGLIGPDDVPRKLWTEICNANGWDDSIIRKGAAANAYSRKLLASGGVLGRRRHKVDHCAFAGCGRWIASGAERCTAGHPQLDGLPAEEAMPF